jgi:hypothetical protein
VLFEGVEVAIGVQRRKAVQDAEGSDGKVDCLSNRDRALPQQTIVRACFDRNRLVSRVLL